MSDRDAAPGRGALRKRRAAVVGAGLGGLASAVELARRGWAVTVFDKQPFTGGKARSEQMGGWRFDLGPSLLTLPQVFRQTFAEAGDDFDAHCTLVPLDPLCHYFWADGTRLKMPGRWESLGALLESRGLASREETEAYRRHVRTLYDIAGPLFLENSLHEASTYLSPRGLWSIARLPWIDAFRSLDALNRASWRDPRMVQLFNRYATYNGSSPYRTPATMGIIPHVEYEWGGWGVAEGIVAIPRAFETLARRLGVEFRLGADVQALVSQGGRIRGLDAGRGFEAYDLVVSNADVLSTYRLLKDEDAPLCRRFKQEEPSSSGWVFYWGLNRSFPELSLHNIFFSKDYKKEFAEIFDGTQAPADPTVYVNISSKISPADAPAGGENWFVLINTPPHRGQDWAAQAPRVRQAVLDRLEAALGPGIAEAIQVEGRWTPADIENLTGSTFGSLYGLSSNSLGAAFARHPNRSRRHQGLYLVGGSAHPGGGMPLAVLSARIAARLIDRYEGGS